MSRMGFFDSFKRLAVRAEGDALMREITSNYKRNKGVYPNSCTHWWLGKTLDWVFRTKDFPPFLKQYFPMLSGSSKLSAVFLPFKLTVFLSTLDEYGSDYGYVCLSYLSCEFYNPGILIDVQRRDMLPHLRKILDDYQKGRFANLYVQHAKNFICDDFREHAQEYCYLSLFLCKELGLIDADVGSAVPSFDLIYNRFSPGANRDKNIYGFEVEM